LSSTEKEKRKRDGKKRLRSWELNGMRDTKKGSCHRLGQLTTPLVLKCPRVAWCGRCAAGRGGNKGGKGEGERAFHIKTYERKGEAWVRGVVRGGREWHGGE